MFRMPVSCNLHLSALLNMASLQPTRRTLSPSRATTRTTPLFHPSRSTTSNPLRHYARSPLSIVFGHLYTAMHWVIDRLAGHVLESGLSRHSNALRAVRELGMDRTWVWRIRRGSLITFRSPLSPSSLLTSISLSWFIYFLEPEENLSTSMHMLGALLHVLSSHT
ncbi:hypothetical protein BDP27DRAFT_293823 [Rhodocollybia butyracea]|uniref:Uncharacterized protein n=1 Tax=Rhodocollybia butyracea TaxID=206335 RepID=A0A9P5U0Z5_9AGAR|nr:hypothetical protein BDP27DRAFT_293823 [Rhodocollybia butyracea]